MENSILSMFMVIVELMFLNPLSKWIVKMKKKRTKKTKKRKILK